MQWYYLVIYMCLSNYWDTTKRYWWQSKVEVGGEGKRTNVNKEAGITNLTFGVVFGSSAPSCLLSRRKPTNPLTCVLLSIRPIPVTNDNVSVQPSFTKDPDRLCSWKIYLIFTLLFFGSTKTSLSIRRIPSESCRETRNSRLRWLECFSHNIPQIGTMAFINSNKVRYIALSTYIAPCDH